MAFVTDDGEILLRLTKIFNDVFDYDGPTLTTDTTADDIEAWDSMSNITLAIEVEHSFGVKVKTAEMESLKNVGDLVALIKAYLISVPG